MQPGNTYFNFPVRVDVGGPAVSTNTHALPAFGTVFAPHDAPVHSQPLSQFPPSQHAQFIPPADYILVPTEAGLVAVPTLGHQHHYYQHHHHQHHNRAASAFQFVAVSPSASAGTFLPAAPLQHPLQPPLLPVAFAGVGNGALYSSTLVAPSPQLVQQVAPPPPPSAIAAPQQRSLSASQASSPSFQSLVLNASTNTNNTRTPSLGPSALGTFVLDNSGMDSSGAFAARANSRPVDAASEWSPSHQQQPQGQQQQQPRPPSQQVNGRPSNPARSPASQRDEQLTVMVCRHFLEGKCNRRKCRFLHPNVVAHTGASDWDPSTPNEQS